MQELVLLAFAFSMVSERLANLIKLYLPGWIRFFTFEKRLKNGQEALDFYEQKEVSTLLIHHLNVKQSDYYLETIRKRIIFVISLCCGILIAFIFSKDITAQLDTRTEQEASIQLEAKTQLDSITQLGTIAQLDSITELTTTTQLKRTTQIETKDDTDEFPILTLIGCGILFSFGSKFWHDILDFILFSKNVQRRIQDINLPTINTAEEAKAYLLKKDQQLAAETIEFYKESLYKQFPKSIRMIETRTENGSLVIVIYIEESIDPADLPKYWVPPNGHRPFLIRVVGGLGPIRAQGRPGSSLFLNRKTTKGTFCCVVKKETDDDPRKRYLLTCGHVLTERKANYGDKQKVLKHTLRTNRDDEIKVAEFDLEDYRDYALLSIDKSEKFHNNKLRGGMGITGFRILDSYSVNEEIFLATSKEVKKCIIHNYRLYKEQKVEYDDNSLAFENLIAIKSTNNSQLTGPGDSGALAYDRAGKAIGMVIGGDKNYTYLQSMDMLNLIHDIIPHTKNP